MPPVAGSIKWSRSLFARVKQTMQKLQDVEAELLQEETGQEVQHQQHVLNSVPAVLFMTAALLMSMLQQTRNPAGVTALLHITSCPTSPILLQLQSHRQETALLCKPCCRLTAMQLC